VRTLILAKRLPAPDAVRSDGVEFVRKDYFLLVDKAGSIENLEMYFREIYAPAAQAAQTSPRWRSIDEGWEMYMAGGLDPKVDHFAEPETEANEGSWAWHLRRELRRFLDGARRLAGADGPEAARRRDQQLMRIGSAAWGAGLSLLMLERRGEAESWLERSALCYRRSLADAEPGSWGRSIGSLKARLIAGDLVGARHEAMWTLDLGADTQSASPTAHYAACLSYLTLGDDAAAGRLATSLTKIMAFPDATAEACRAMAAREASGYERAIRAVLRTFEERPRYLEDIPVADTVVALQALAGLHNISVPLVSPTLPATPNGRHS
jgi:hypothetical protein